MSNVVYSLINDLYDVPNLAHQFLAAGLNKNQVELNIRTLRSPLISNEKPVSFVAHKDNDINTYFQSFEVPAQLIS